MVFRKRFNGPRVVAKPIAAFVVVDVHPICSGLKYGLPSGSKPWSFRNREYQSAVIRNVRGRGFFARRLVKCRLGTASLRGVR